MSAVPVSAPSRGRTIENLDLLSDDDLRALARDYHSNVGQCVSVLMPTFRFGPETLQGPIRLRGLIAQAESALAAAGTPTIDAEHLLAPIRAKVDDPDYWQHQGDGLAIYSWADGSVDFRLPLALEEECVVATTLRVRPLLPLLSDSGTFMILSLSQNSVRLFRATRFSVTELDLGDDPWSMDDALAHEDHEPHTQMHTGGTGAARSHGHGVGGEIDKEALARYFRAVDRGLDARFGPIREPVVVACVGYYLPIFQSVSTIATILPTAVEGTPDDLSSKELHAAAWPLVEPLFAGNTERSMMSYANATGTGLTATATTQLIRDASEGRIDSLFVTTGCPSQWGRVDPSTGAVTTSTDRQPLDEDLIDRVVLETLCMGGAVIATPGQPEPGVDVAALLRH